MDREKVIRELKAARLFFEMGSNRADGAVGNLGCKSGMKYIDDALALLKEQEPKVLTLEEALVDNNNSIEISPYVFVEVKGRNDIFIGSVHDDIYGDYHSNDIKVRVYRIWMSDSKTYPKADYMKTVRFWNRKPTDEQRKTVKWE